MLNAKQNDYQEAWSQFIAVLSGSDPLFETSLAERVVKAVGDVVGANGGAVWLHEHGARFRIAGTLELASKECKTGEHRILAAWLATHDEIMDLSRNEHVGRMVSLPDWMPHPPRAWLLMPLLHRGWLFGFIVLTKMESKEPLGRNERDLMRMVARAAASYLAEEDTSRRLREAQEFDSFNRRFAYVMHDIKNVAGQLSLTLSNAKMHRGNPEFYNDMLETIDNSVQRLRRLMDRIREGEPQGSQPLRLDRLLNECVSQRTVKPDLIEPLPPLVVLGRSERLGNAIEHLITNAMESGGSTSADVRICLQKKDSLAVVRITDNGCGMSQSFIRDELFTPFRSTKPGGYGIGMTEVQEILDEMGGKLEVESQEGMGTTMILTFPIIQESDQ